MWKKLIWTAVLAVVPYTKGFCQANLNGILSSYSSNIKVCNAPYANSCIYETNYVRVEQSGDYLVIQYGFAWDSERNDYISKNSIRVNLRTSTFYTGMWYNSFGRWDHVGNKNVLTIEDENGIDLYITGTQSYNQGTKRNLINSICFDMGTEPVANKVLNEFLNLQKGYKEKDPWLQPVVTQKERINSNTPKKNPHRARIVKKQAPNNKRVVRKTKSGKYGQ